MGHVDYGKLEIKVKKNPRFKIYYYNNDLFIKYSCFYIKVITLIKIYI